MRRESGAFFLAVIREERLLAKYFGGKRLNPSAEAPSIEWETCFPAGFIEERFPIPAVLNGNLRQQQASAVLKADEKAVFSHLDSVGRHVEQWRHHTDLDLEFTGFGCCHRLKARIFESGSGSGLGDGFVKGRHRQHVANAPTQFPAQVECRKCATRFGKMRAGWRQFQGMPVKTGVDGAVCQLPTNL